MFRLRDDADEFFSRIASRLARTAPKFDMYYFCLIAGIANRRRVPELSKYEARDLVDNFPGEYRSRAEMIVGLFLTTELNRLEVNREDKVAVHNTVGKLIDPRSMSFLSSDGIYGMNAYSYAGCDVLRQEWFNEPPSSLEFFLITYKDKLDHVMGKSMTRVGSM